MNTTRTNDIQIMAITVNIADKLLKLKENKKFPRQRTETGKRMKYLISAHITEPVHKA